MMNPTITYNLDFDFLSYMALCANIKARRKAFNAELKQNPHLKNKDAKRRTTMLIKDAEAFYHDALSYIQRNELDMFFKGISIFKHYLKKLILSNTPLEAATVEDFKDFVLCKLELTEPDLTFETLVKGIKDYYDDPSIPEDYAKEAELILETLNNPRLFDTIFKSAVASLKATFTEHKYTPIEATITQKLAAHNERMGTDPVAFIVDLTSGLIKEEELKGKKLQTYMTFYTYYKLTFEVDGDVSTIVYHHELENIRSETSEKDLIQSLIKFLSDPKRYQMVQMLSKKKWYANELAKEFKITPATMSYHVNKMFALGLISFEQGEQNKLYMALDKERLDDLLIKVMKDLTHE